MKPYLKYPLIVVSIIMIAIVALLSYVSLAFPKVNAAPELTIEITPEKVERGRYLANHVMVCADCHSVRDYALFSGPPTPGTEFVGGDVFDQSMGFPGKFISSNITPAGIGDWTDGELFRLITTGVKRDGEPIFPVMPYHNYGLLDEEDIKSVIAFLRTLEPVESNHAASEADFPFNFILRTIPKNPELGVLPSPEEKVEYGKYLFTASACGDCHTRFEKGEFVRPHGVLRRASQSPAASGFALRT